jgi:hypothetical protein
VETREFRGTPSASNLQIEFFRNLLEMTPSNSTMFLKETQAVLQYVPAELKDLVNSKLKGKALRAALRAILSKY